MLEVKKTILKDVLLIRTNLYRDERGFFQESWNKKEIINIIGKGNSFVQDNHSMSKLNAIRGLHYQSAPYEGAKLVRCTKGGIWDIVLDLRPNSKTFKEWYSVELLHDNYKANYVPEGCAHAYQTLEDNSEVFYLNAQIYNLDSEKGIRYSDPAFNILFPLDVTEISKKDSSWKLFES